MLIAQTHLHAIFSSRSRPADVEGNYDRRALSATENCVTVCLAHPAVPAQRELFVTNHRPISHERGDFISGRIEDRHSHLVGLRELEGDLLFFDVPLGSRREDRREIEALHRRGRVLEPLGDHECGKAREHQQREHDLREALRRRSERRRRLPCGAQSLPPSAKRSTVSERNPSRSVSSESTSPGTMLPRFDSVPNLFSSHTCCSRWGASKISLSASIACAISSIKPVLTSPSAR